MRALCSRFSMVLLYDTKRIHFNAKLRHFVRIVYLILRVYVTSCRHEHAFRHRPHTDGKQHLATVKAAQFAHQDTAAAAPRAPSGLAGLRPWKEVAYKLLGKADEAAQKKARRIHAKAIESLSISA